MVQLAQAIFYATAILAPILQAAAAGVETVGIDAEWKTPAFAECIHSYNANGNLTDANAILCRHNHATDFISKRAINYADFLDDNGELDERDTLHLLEGRSSYSIDGADCVGSTLPFHFDLAKTARKDAKTYCTALWDKLSDDLVDVVDKNLNNAASEVSGFLNSNQGVALQYLFALTPYGKSMLASKTLTKKTYKSMCESAWKTLHKEKEGCVKEVTATHSSSGKVYDVKGAQSGSIAVRVKNSGKYIGFLSKMFLEQGSQDAS